VAGTTGPRADILMLMDTPAPPTLRREVESPRTGGVWGPVMALVGSAMLTVMSAVAVLARPPHTPPAMDGAQVEVHRPMVTPAQVRVEACQQRVWRANPDGHAEQFEDCSAVVR